MWAINIFMVNFEWYRSFIEVYRVGTASGAVQILHLTQPAVSQHIAALESALALSLVVLASVSYQITCAKNG
jgi:DNA-binding transcriptional LysR family regulator